MKYGRVAADDSPCSAFVREMKAALQRRLEATTAAERRAATEEMRAVMLQHLGPGGAARGSVDGDGKLASCGRDE